MTNPLSNLAIDYWYKAAVVICTTLLIISLTVPVHVIGNALLLIFSLGGVFIGLGEWINHPLQVRLIAPHVTFPTGGATRGYPRNPSGLGMSFDIIGFLFIIWGCVRLFLNR